MNSTVLEREDYVITYDACRMPVGLAFRKSEDERYKGIVRLLKAWGVSSKPSRKKHLAPLRKRRIIYCRFKPHADSDFIAFLLTTTKAASRRPPLELELKTIFDRLSALKGIEDVDDEYILKPTERAYIKTKLMIMKTYDRMGQRFPKPRIVPDGEGGIVAAWRRSGRRVRLRFQATEDYQDYIYYQSDDQYDVEAASIGNIRKRLDWLNSS